jgi:hypothetical protein
MFPIFAVLIRKHIARRAPVVFVCWLGLYLHSGMTRGDELSARQLLTQFCVDCHGGESPEAHLNLEQFGVQPRFDTQFRTWEKVIDRLRDGQMPPPEAPQPSESQRRELIEAVVNALESYVNEHAGDPGRVVMQRLTGAEYAYSIEDLTGLKLIDQDDLAGDAVGGAGFTNAGDAQFIEEATFERYLEAAKKVAAHAMIGSGPLDFDVDPGQTGLELSAIRRIQVIYRRYGFRTAAGEGGKPFGLELYPKAFYSAWRFRHRQALGQLDVSLAGLASEEGLEPRFAEYIHSILTMTTDSFPMREIVTGWQELPGPDGASDETVRQACGHLYERLRYWQHLLASASSDEEEAPVLADGNVELTSTRSFKATLNWAGDAPTGTLELSVLSVAKTEAKPLVRWHNPRVRFRRDRRWTPYEPLHRVLTEEGAQRLSFGRHPTADEIEANDFVLGETKELVLEFPVPAGATSAQFVVDVGLDLKHGDECVVRCTVSDGANSGETVAATGSYSALLADPNGPTYLWLKPGIEEFARKLPEISHREPAPSDRDPIPAPFDGTYNTPERNHFHAKIKYHRDDAFLVQYLLDEATRCRLDQAWTDLLTSFDYHDEFYRVVAQKYHLPTDRRVADFDAAWMASLPAESRTFVERLHNDCLAARQALADAEPQHIEQALQFAEHAWRRPLTEAEQDRLRAFYSDLRQQKRMEHVPALRLLLARILVAPAFLYRAEAPGPSPDPVPLSDWELASRLSYFLWSSLPDEELRQAATAGHLRDTSTLADQARRMLRDPKARRLATEFFGQWFGFYRFDRYRGVDGGRFPEFSDSLKQAMYDEAVSFFSHVVREDRPIREILFADYTFVDPELARHYGLPPCGAGVPPAIPEAGRTPAPQVRRQPGLPPGESRETTKIDGADAYHRGGLLRLGAVLTVTSAPLRTSPVKRGDWILRRVLSTPVPPPPANAGSIAADDVQADGQSVKQRLEAHRRDATCVNCHSRMDPLGFALEHYDTIGRWRQHYHGERSIDSSGVLNDGVTISGVDGLLDYLTTHERQFHQTLCTRLLGYALGRTELASDRPLLNELVGELDQGGKFSDLVVKIVSSKQFRFRRASELTAEEKLSAAGSNHEN